MLKRRFMETPRWADALYVVPYHVSLVIRCACGRETAPDVLEFRKAAGLDTFKVIESRLRCQACGEKQARIAIGSFEE